MKISIVVCFFVERKIKDDSCKIVLFHQENSSLRWLAVADRSQKYEIKINVYRFLSGFFHDNCGGFNHFAWILVGGLGLEIMAMDKGRDATLMTDG